MSNNHLSGSAIPSVPSRQCADYAGLLPVLDEPETEAHAAAHARAHLASCAFCQARMTQYAQLDAVIVRAVGPAATPRKNTEDIMRDILREDATQTDQTAATQRVSASPLPAVSDTGHPQRPHLPHPPQVSRRRWSGLASVAAVLAVALLAAILFAGHSRGGPGAKATPTPNWGGPGSETTLASISMVSPTEGWAVGQAAPANATNGNQARPLLMHYRDGAWTSMRLSTPGQLNTISMVSASDGWALGEQGLILHFDGTTWRQVASPTQGGFTQVQMVSPTDGWAVADNFATHANGGLFHYDGHAWTAQPLPTTFGGGGGPYIGAVSLTAISMLSPTDGWAIGNISAAGPGTPPAGKNAAAPAPITTLILRYHTGTWTVDATLASVVSQPDSPMYLQSIVMVSAQDGWAVGRIDTQSAGLQPAETGLLLLHYSGGAWHQVANPLAGTAYQDTGAFQVAMRTAEDGWIVGSSPSASKRVALHYDGTRWNVVALPDLPHSAGWYLTGLVYTPAGDLWAIGARLSDASTGESDGHGGFTPTITPVILHEKGGVWSVVMK